MNPYIKQFPDLMSGKKIMYVHGFLSSGQSGTVKMLQELMPNATFVAEDIPVHPEEAVEMLQKLVEAEKPDLIIGTSMGGMYTEMLKGYDRILVNPAFEMGNTMSSMTGKQEFQNPRKDGVNELMVTKGLIKEYRDITERFKFFFTAFLYVALALSCSLVAYTLPAGYCLLFIRGVVIGGAGCVMISVFKFDGLFIFIFVTFIQGLILTAIISSVISCNLDLLRKKGCRKPDRKYKLTTSAMALAACLILTIYGIIIIGLVIRPMYAVF